MRVPANEQLRRISIYFRLNQRTVFARIAADMCHPYINIFAFKPEVFGVGLPDLCAIDIAVNALQRLISS